MHTNYRKFLALVFFFLILYGCALPGGRRREVPKIDIIIENPLQVKREDEFVVLRVSDLKEVAPDFSQNTFIVLQTDSNQEVPNQLDDMDNDGEGDEIAMITTMEPKEKKRITIRYSPESPENRAITLGHKRRTRSAIHPEYEGVGLESELIAFIIHPDHRNSISVIGKQERGLLLDRFAESKNTGSSVRGVKVLEGGDTTGCGGFGLWHNGKIVRPVSKPGEDIGRYTRVVADGPIRSVVQVIFDKWQVGDQKLRVAATYSIFAGQRWSSNKVKIEGAKEPVKIAIGLTKSKTAPLINNEKEGFFYTYGALPHLSPQDNVGIALVYPMEGLDSFQEDDNSYMAILNPGADNEITYFFLSAWGYGTSGVKGGTQFADLVASVAQNVRHPLTATLMPVKKK